MSGATPTVEAGDRQIFYTEGTEFQRSRDRTGECMSDATYWVPPDRIQPCPESTIGLIGEGPDAGVAALLPQGHTVEVAAQEGCYCYAPHIVIYGGGACPQPEDLPAALRFLADTLEARLASAGDPVESVARAGDYWSWAWGGY